MWAASAAGAAGDVGRDEWRFGGVLVRVLVRGAERAALVGEAEGRRLFRAAVLHLVLHELRGLFREPEFPPRPLDHPPGVPQPDAFQHMGQFGQLGGGLRTVVAQSGP